MAARQKKVLMILIPASLVLIWRVQAMVRYLPSSASATVVAAPEPADETVMDQFAEVVISPEAEAAIRRAQQEIEAQPWGRDPFGIRSRAQPTEAQAEMSPVATPEPPPAAPRIAFTGVSRSGDRWIAVVGGNFVRVGDIVEQNYRVVEIAKGSITLEYGGWTLRYDLGAESPVSMPSGGRP